jgi:hypothetical protein
MPVEPTRRLGAGIGRIRVSGVIRVGMLFLEPETLLEQLTHPMSDSLLSTIEEDPSKAKYSILLLKDTLSYAAKQSESRNEALYVRYRSLEDTLDTLVALADDDQLVADLEERTRRLDGLELMTIGHREAKSLMNEIVDDLLAMANENRFGDGTKEARAAVYDHFETAVESELDMLR